MTDLTRYKEDQNLLLVFSFVSVNICDMFKENAFNFALK